ncbi:hypothetical protein HK100_002113 [Physocladia obscura]|uniref:CBS-domain-containing protein n=1 Tax=Physocladia obscura TaxID=109957 RepID=A0AAD5TA08_9FUNG|nr:hypothetical protein HK100_002113 [Physocladia obscura]
MASLFPPGYIPNYALLASWNSASAAFAFMGVAIVFFVLILRNAIYFAKTLHTRAAYGYLLIWCVFRIVALAMRGNAVSGDNGQTVALYQWAQIAASIGFMPLAKVLLFNLLESTIVIFNLKASTRLRWKIEENIAFAFFVLCVCIYVFDFTLNKPFGSNAKDYTGDIVMREIGFNGLLLFTVYSFFGSIRNLYLVSRTGNVDDGFIPKIKRALLMIIKLLYITYRNWNPDELKAEKYWYGLSITPEVLYMLFFCSHRFLDVFDKIEAHETKGRSAKASPKIQSDAMLSNQQQQGQASPSRVSLVGDQSDVFRHRNKRRDDIIRKKAETELSRKISSASKRMSLASVPSSQLQTQSHIFNRKSKGYANTVASLKPNQAITVLETARIVQAAQLMAAKRADAVLVVNEEGQLSGILTDKDIAYRVVAEGLDLRQTTVSQCMTRNPVAVLDKGPRNEALSVMVSRRFRHLPVISAEEDDGGVDTELASTATTPTSTNVVGLLDITKCVFERLDDLEKKVLEDANIVAAMEALERRGHLDGEQVGMVRLQHGCPELHTILAKNDAEGTGEIPEVGIKATVREAAKIMKQFHQTAVLVLSSGGPGVEDRLGGIFTTKDIVLRVIAAGLDPGTTSVVRVMTPHPDAVDSSTTILEALKKLHVGHYLHLPVVDGEVPVGLVDVLTLTMGMLDYLMNKATGKEEDSQETKIHPDGPMWNEFWNSTFNNGSIHETESAGILDEDDDDITSVTSAGQRRRTSHFTRDFTTPRQSRQSIQIGSLPQFVTHSQTSAQFSQPQRIESANSPPPSTVFSQPLDTSQFGFKLRDNRSGKIHRFTSSSTDVNEVYGAIRAKIGTAPGVVSYEDDDKDLVLLGSNADLEEAVGMARRLGWERLILHVGEIPVVSIEKPGVSASPVPQEKSVPRQENSDGTVADFLRDAPMAVNVAISAGIVVVAAFAISKMHK